MPEESKWCRTGRNKETETEVIEVENSKKKKKKKKVKRRNKVDKKGKDGHSTQKIKITRAFFKK